jgi:hypothetical protein
MINNYITRELLENGSLKRGSVIVLYKDMSFMTFSCKIQKIIKEGDTYILKLRTGKDYPLGHKYIYRSIEEII